MCDTIVNVGSDGVLFAKNSDRDANESQLLEWVPGVSHSHPEPVHCTWIDVAQVPTTYATVISRPWWMWGAEMGANEHGVVIGNEAVFTTEPRGEPALLGMDLLRLALERARSAPDAAGVIVALLERYGQGGPCSHERPRFTYDNSFLIADANGAFVLETAGRNWASEEVRHGARAISNALTIEGFADRYSQRLRSAIANATVRRTRCESAASEARGPGDFMALLRDHGPSKAPQWSLINGTLHAPCVHAGGVLASSQTTASFVSDLRDAPLHWATATSAPCTSVFKPVRVTVALDLGSPPTNHYDGASTWWRHERLHRTVLKDFAGLHTSFQDERDSLEARWISDPPDSERAFAETENLERSWLERLPTPDRDHRPPWVRSTWRRLDHSAHMPVDAA